MMFNFIQNQFEKARVAWAEHGGSWNLFRLEFWQAVYLKMKIPRNKEKPNDGRVKHDLGYAG